MDLNKIAINAANTVKPLLSAGKKAAGKAVLNADVNLQKGLAGLDAVSNGKRCLVKAANSVDIELAVADKIEKLKNQASEIVTKNFTLSDGGKVKFDVFCGTKAGSNNGFYLKSKEGGELFYAKFPAPNKSKILQTGISQAQSEVLASKIYGALGLDVPKMQLIRNENGDIGVLSKYVSGLSPVRQPKHALNKGFGADIFLANWDSVISDNAQTNGQKLFRIDFGGALNFRAQGERKDFGYVVNELTTMINPEINTGAAHLFSKMTRKELISSLQNVVSIDDKTLKQIVMENGGDKHLYDVLLKRKEFLSYVLETVENTPKNNRTMLEYLGEVKKHVLETPLTEFETYRKKNPDAARKFKAEARAEQFKQKIAAKLLPKEDGDYSSITKNMIKQREKLSADFPDDCINEELANIKDCFGFMNNEIRGGNGESGQIRALDRIISKSQIPQNAVLYRGATPYDFGVECAGVKSSEFLDRFYKKGDYFSVPIFLNTSLDENVAKGFSKQNLGSILYKINAPKGTHGVYMEKLPYSNICKSMNEEEIILSRDLVYRFKNRIPYFGRDVVEIDVVNKVPKGAFVHNFAKEIH